MKEVLVVGTNLPDAYHEALLSLYRDGEELSCNDWNQKQKEISMTFVAENATLEPMISKCFIGGHHELQQYKMEFLDGILDFNIGKDKMWSYTYHNRYKYQLPFIISELKRNSDTRRAIMNIRDFEIDSLKNDPACLQSIQYFIRNNKLHCKVLMRSNDATEATFMNAFAFIMLQQKIANELNIQVGSYTHRANSFHCYEKDYKLLEQYIEGILYKDLSELTYYYEDFYKELMEEEIPSILNMVEELKKH